VFKKLMFSSVYLSFALVVISLLSLSVAESQTVSADFGYRSGTTPVVPSGLFAVGGVGSNLKDQASINGLATAGINETRIWMWVSQNFATPQTPNYNHLDSTLVRLKSAGINPIIVLYGTPPSLGANPCGAPSDFQQWGQMAATVVAHVDQKFPGMVQDYEIWNEPDSSATLCVPDATARYNAYVSIFAAAASAMHAQAKADGEPIRTGGPVLASVADAPVWITGLLTNELTAPYVDFVSFHIYLTGQTQINNGMTWSNLYSYTQSSTSGMAALYKSVESLVRAGRQPNPASTPIYVSEFNDNWAASVDCCRNDPTYGSLWNSVAVTDLLNAVYSGASAVPSRLAYFNSIGDTFCIMGEWNSKMDCNPSVMEPYPQFYTFQLFASSDYLDLQAGGHMAVSVSPASTTTGLEATAFYTSTADSVVVFNPTSTDYSAVNITLTNPGLTSPKGEIYLLNSSHGQISSEPVALTSVTGGYSAQVEIPPYSTVALSVKGIEAGSPPTAVLTVTPQSGTHSLTVNIDSSQSQGGGSYIIGRTISFGDGKWLNWTPTTSYTYNKPGTYTILLTVRDQFGQLSSASSVVTVH
jgi:PKD repeat protein